MNRSFSSALILTAALVGCGGNAIDSTDDFSGIADEKADSFSSKMKIVGSIEYGGSLDFDYTKTPRFRAVKLAGNDGDQVDVTVSSQDGQPVAWLLDNKFKVVAEGNDTALETASVKLDAKLAKTGTFYVVVREKSLKKATFLVSLEGQSSALTACDVDADCVAVDVGGCCPHGEKTAITKGKESAYAAQHGCDVDPRPLCPLYVINDTRVAQCNTAKKSCEMVKPEDIQCEGFTRNPHECAPGYACDHTGINPDLPGTCKAVNDCRSTGCGSGKYCTFCWGNYACIPNGALC